MILSRFVAVAMFVAFIAAGAGAFLAEANHIGWLLAVCLVLGVASLVALGVSLLSVDRAVRHHEWRTFERDFWQYVSRERARQ